LPPFDHSFVAVALARSSEPIGAVLLVLTPEQACWRWCRRRSIRHRAVRLCRADQHVACRPRRHPPRAPLHPFPAVVLPVSVYGGYFGAGVGVLMLGVLSVGTAEPTPANVTKNCDRVEQRHRHRDLCGLRGGVGRRHCR
jgi:hypothetical protein